MIIIPLIEQNGCMIPGEPIPDDAVRVYYDATECTVYQPGDELPPEPVYDPVE